MNNAQERKVDGSGRILMFSLRNIFPSDLWRCPLYEFEDIICQIDNVDVVAPRRGKWFELRAGIAKRLVPRVSIACKSGISPIQITKQYDMLLMICSFPQDLLNLSIVKHWKDRCKTSVCLVDEIWMKELPHIEYYVRLLSQFDHVMLYYSQSVTAVSQTIKKQCFFLPPGVDAIKFCPYPNPPKRVIDVYSYGRRSEITHRTLMNMAAHGEIFYVYDSMSASGALNPEEHRLLLANMGKRSRFLIANPGLIDRPDIRGDQIEIGNRYFEGAAAGTILIGETPNNEAFAKEFDWRDAVFHLPFGSDEIDLLLRDLDSQPERQRQIRKNNIIQSLMRHDWAYRWETVLRTAGLKPLGKMSERKDRLKSLSGMVEDELGKH